jgi:adenylosuccinate lyase
MSHDLYENPLISRYASREMCRLWGEQRKFSTWRRLWVILAETEQELGLAISAEQIAELKAHVETIDFAAAEAYEKKLRHDVMAHVHAYADVCPTARPIIHLGATSCYVTDNTDLILMREGLSMVAGRLAGIIDALGRFAQQHRDLPCLAFTHFQPAQPTTVGKRACLWAYDLALDLTEVDIASRRSRPAASREPPALRPVSSRSFMAIMPRCASSSSSSPSGWASTPAMPSRGRRTRGRSMPR